ncbi:type II secretion system F family protein [Singulisphaera sp. PoT]|uniref:type II secretion system F family protein n=1 Tax=Singulisphaera sp. PoT TaxID=3411797 RepID=UPI003BF5C053
MSRDPEDPRPPRRPKAPRPADADEYGVGDQASTWRPSPHPPKDPERSGLKASKSTKGRSLDDMVTERIKPDAGPSWWERIVFGQVSSGLLSQFCRQFAAYLSAGVDIIKALQGLEKQFNGTALGPVIGRMTLGIRKGDTLADVVAKEPGAFDSLFLSMIRVAETRGGVPETLRRMGQHYEGRQKLIRQARSAMIYPIAVLLVASGVVALMTIWILPMFAQMLREMAPKTSLPLPSRILMGFSDFMAKAGWIVVPAIMVAIPFVGLRVYGSPAGKKLLDKMALYVPVLGALLRKIDTTRFAQTLSALLAAGVDIGTSLDLTADVMRLDPFRSAMKKAKKSVMDGGDLSTALSRANCFYPDVIAIVGSGEDTGKIPESLEKLAEDYEEQVTYMVKNMGQLVQPILMVVMGGAVLFIILAVFLPYISMITSLTR